MSVTSKLSGRKVKAPHIVVRALAGTGKTTTAVHGTNLVLDPSAAKKAGLKGSEQQDEVWAEMGKDQFRMVEFMAFNNSIANELKARLPQGCVASTIHSKGNQMNTAAFGYSKPNSWKVYDHLDKIDPKLDTYVKKCVKDVVDLSKLTLTAEVDEGRVELHQDKFEDLVEHYGLNLNGSSDKVLELSNQVLQSTFDNEKKRDFTDMIWFPVVKGLKCRQSDLTIVDECVPGWMPVMLANGDSMTIKEIVESDNPIHVRAYDTRRGVAKNCRVIGRHTILNQKPLVKIKVKHHKKIRGNFKHNFVVCTIDHKVWTINRGWVPAGDIQVGDDVIIETAAKTTQKGKITKKGRDNLSSLQQGNTRGLNNRGSSKEAFLKVRKGNGHGPTLAESVLLEALQKFEEYDWVWNYSVPTKRMRGYRKDMPYHYKIDIADPHRKIAIEVDGQSHRGREHIDRKKHRLLEKNGWTVYRISNRQAIQRPDEAVCEITGNCPRPASVVSVDPIEIPDNYVYDITVENCHNFYANGILVHNCQDLNACQLALVLKSGRRMMFIGDPNQAIYGFAGAGIRSIEDIRDTLGTSEIGLTDLRLTYTRRCPKEVVAYAKSIVPDFEALPEAPQGSVDTWTRDGFFQRVEYGDMVLCRTNAPLISHAFRFIRNDRRVKIQGRNIGDNLVSLVNKSKATYVDDLLTWTEDYRDTEIARVNKSKHPSENQIQVIHDRSDCIKYLCEGENLVSAVVDRIKNLFEDIDGTKKSDFILLSSVHRAKGLEAKRVCVLHPELLPFPYAKLDWERQQERNLQYVAYTRAMSELVFVK